MKLALSGSRRAWAIGALLAGLGVAGFLAAGESGNDGETWARIERRDLVVGVELEGELEAIESAQLGPPAVESVGNFKISLLAPEGTEVRADQPVLGFDTTELQQRLQQLVAERDSAEKTLEKRRTDLVIQREKAELQLAEAQARLRRSELALDVPPESKARRELEAAKIDHRLAELEIRSIESGLEHEVESTQAELRALDEKRLRAIQKVGELQAQLESMTVRAPRAGTLIYISNWRGEKKKVGDSVWRAEKVVEVPSLDRMRANCTVDEAAVGRLEPGQPVRLRLDAYPDREIAGTVRSIRGTVQRKSWRDPRKIVRVEVELEETDPERMRPGMRVRGEVEVERAAGVVVVPLEAVRTGAGGASVVVRTLLGRREAHPEFGRRNRELLEVRSGLETGDRVLVGTGGGS